MRISDWSSDVCSSDLRLSLPSEQFLRKDIDIRQDAPRTRGEQTARFGQPHTSPMSHQELDAKLIFKMRDMTGNRRLREVHFGRRARDPPVLGDFREIA